MLLDLIQYFHKDKLSTPNGNSARDEPTGHRASSFATSEELGKAMAEH